LSDNDKKDLTRIEDLSDFIHDENEDLSDLETFGDEEDDDDALMDQATDPDIEFPPEFQVNSDDNSDEDSDTNTNDETDAFNTEFESGEEASFGSDDDSFDSDDDSFGSDDDSFGNDDDSFGSDDDSFGSNEDSFGNDDDNSFDNEDSFASDEDNSFNDDDSFTDEDSFNDNSEVYASDESEDEVEDISLDEEFNDDSNEAFDPPPLDTLASEEPPIEESIEEPSQEMATAQEVDSIESPKTESAQKTPIPQYADKEEFKSPENFNELQKFAKNISYGNMGHEGNPPFSIILKDIKFKEDIEEIVEILREFNIIDDESERAASESLLRGNMLIPRLGEYSAIHLCHKLRKFDVTILMGLTEEVHPPKSYESDDSGIVSKYTVYNTRSHHYVYDQDDIQLADIMTSTTPTLEGYHIREYITVSSEYIILDSKTIASANTLEGELKEAIPDYQREKLDRSEVLSANKQAANSSVIKDFFPSNDAEVTDDNNSANLNDVYKSLLEKLKLKALKNKGNAIIGVNYNVTPILKDQIYYTETQYQITCSGSIVWANRV
tara:strand:- start:85073 stop:86728 length:1656 start_codon:yes stop_codon:yes gene_type:complete